MNKRLIFFLLVIGFLLRVSFLFIPIPELLYFINDDAFYYLKLSENFVKFQEYTFDGITSTNGFHMVYFLYLIGVFSLLKGFHLYIGILILSFFSVLSSLIVYKITIVLTKSEKAGFFTFFIYLLNPWLVIFPIKGMEVPISSFFLLMFLLVFIKIHFQKCYNIRNMILFSIFAFFAFLSRSDSIIFILLIYLYLLLKERKTAVLFSGVLFLLLSFPWFLWNITNFGLFMQASGEAKKLIIPIQPSLQHITTILLKFSEIATGFVAFTAFFVGVFISSVLKLKFSKHFPIKYLILILFISSFLPLIKNLSNETRLIFWLLSLILAFFSFVLGLFIKTKRIKFNSLFTLSLSYYVILFSVYFFYYLHFSGWYLYFPTVLFVVLIGLLYENLKMFFDNKKIYKILALIFMLKLLSLSYMKPASPCHVDIYEISLWIDSALSNSKIGVFNAGIYSYFIRNNTVVNLDGVMNNEIFEFVKNGGSVSQYAHQSNIQYVVDYDWMIKKYFKESEIFLVKIFETNRECAHPKIGLYRIIGESK